MKRRRLSSAAGHNSFLAACEHGGRSASLARLRAAGRPGRHCWNAIAYLLALPELKWGYLHQLLWKEHASESSEKRMACWCPGFPRHTVTATPREGPPLLRWEGRSLSSRLSKWVYFHIHLEESMIKGATNWISKRKFYFIVSIIEVYQETRKICFEGRSIRLTFIVNNNSQEK